MWEPIVQEFVANLLFAAESPGQPSLERRSNASDSSVRAGSSDMIAPKKMPPMDPAFVA